MISSTPIGVTVWNCASRYQRDSSGKGFPPSFPPFPLLSVPPSSFPCSPPSSLPPPLPPSLPTIVMVQTRPVCGVIRVDFQHPRGGDSSPEASGKIVCHYFKWNLLDESYSTTTVLRATVIFTRRFSTSTRI